MPQGWLRGSLTESTTSSVFDAGGDGFDMPEPRSLEERAEEIMDVAEQCLNRIDQSWTRLANREGKLEEPRDRIISILRAYAEQEVEHEQSLAWLRSKLLIPKSTEHDALLAAARAAQAFEQKLATVQAAIDGAFMMQQIHGFPYQGPHYGEEIKGLRDALAHPDVQRLIKEGDNAQV